MKRALEWLDLERQEHRLLAAVLVLKQLATNAPTLFSVQLTVFIERVWVALRDQKQSIREKAVEAVIACLDFVKSRSPQRKKSSLCKNISRMY
eukprot:UN18601